MVKQYHRYSLNNIDAENVLAEEFEHLVLKRNFHSQHNRKCTEKYCPYFICKQSVKSVKICQNVCNYNNGKNARIDYIVFHQYLFNRIFEIAVPKSKWEQDDCVKEEVWFSRFFECKHKCNSENC